MRVEVTIRDDDGKWLAEFHSLFVEMPSLPVYVTATVCVPPNALNPSVTDDAGNAYVAKEGDWICSQCGEYHSDHVHPEPPIVQLPDGHREPDERDY
jgi:hypothetical protein